jgi:hypothetical protein
VDVSCQTDYCIPRYGSNQISPLARPLISIKPWNERSAYSGKKVIGSFSKYLGRQFGNWTQRNSRRADDRSLWFGKCQRCGGGDRCRSRGIFDGHRVSQNPEITTPTIVVTAQYPGADSKTLAEEVAEPIEQQVNEVRNIGVTTQKQSPDILMAIGLTSKSKTYSSLYLSNYAYTQIEDSLKRIAGVGNVTVLRGAAVQYACLVKSRSDVFPRTNRRRCKNR